MPSGLARGARRAHSKAADEAKKSQSGCTSTATWYVLLVGLLSSHWKVSSFVVLDDEHASSFAVALPPNRVVCTVMQEGLSKDRTAEALAILARPFDYESWT